MEAKPNKNSQLRLNSMFTDTDLAKFQNATKFNVGNVRDYFIQI